MRSAQCSLTNYEWNQPLSKFYGFSMYTTYSVPPELMCPLADDDMFKRGKGTKFEAQMCKSYSGLSLPDGNVCVYDYGHMCKSGICGLYDDKETPRCCSTTVPKAFGYVTNTYCSGLPSGENCKHDAQCTSGSCSASWLGLGGNGSEGKCS